MKRFSACFSAILLFTIIFVFSSCNESIRIDNNQSDSSEEVLVSLKFAGEYVSVDKESLPESSNSRGLDNNNLYLIQVYYLPEGSTTASPFCYGVFNDVSNLKLKLVKGQTYRITASVIVDGYAKLTTFANVAPNPGNGGTMIRSLTSGFVSDSTNQMDVMSNYYIRTEGQTVGCFNPEIDRYGAISESIVASADLSEITLLMKRFVFGIKVNVSGLEKGSVVVSNPNSESDRTFISTTTIEENGSCERIYAMSVSFNLATYRNESWYFDTLISNYINGTPTNRYPIKVVYKDDEDLQYELYNEVIDFERLKQTVLNISVPSPADLNKKSFPLGFSFEENSDLIEEEAISISYNS